MKINQILHQIDSGDIALPEFQRGYVWNRDQVRGLFTSLYRGYPVGGFMTWNTAAETASARSGISTDGTVKLLLDGQQRVTSLYGVIRGKAPKFFEGDGKTFTGLRFNVQDESFEFFAPAKMRNDPAWIDVTEVFLAGPAAIGAHYPALLTLTNNDASRAGILLTRLTQVAAIGERDMHIEEVVGPDKTVDIVVDIFNRVNSGGTKLSKGDLALAKVCASWPEARHEFNEALAEWQQAGFYFRLDWLLRVVNAVVTGKAPFTALAQVPATEIQQGLKQARKYVGAWLDVIAGRLGLDHDRVLFSQSALVIMARLMHTNGGKLPDAATQSRVLAWYLHTGMWGRYAGSTESLLSQDLEAADAQGIDGLLSVLRQWRGDLAVRESDFAGSTVGSRFYPTLYMLTRTQSSRDLGTGVVLSASLLGYLSSLEVHHIFPKALLRDHGYDRSQINAVANFCFLTKLSNIQIGKTHPTDYLPLAQAAHPGVLASQWIPSSPDLWTLDRFPEFLASRRKLLADATNKFLTELENGVPTSDDDLPRTIAQTEVDEDDDQAGVRGLADELHQLGYARPLFDAEVADDDTGELLATVEALWPAGLQEGIGNPVALELDEQQASDALAARGYDVFTSVGALREFVRRQHATTDTGR